MSDRALQLAYDDGEPDWFVLSELHAGSEPRKACLPSQGWDLDQLREAALATGWAFGEQDRLRLAHGTTAIALRDLLGDMFDYFVAPGVATQQLLEVQAAVESLDIVRDAAVTIPLFGHAWLDVVVRADLAEAARGAHDVWSPGQLAIDPQPICRRRVHEAIQRFAQDASSRQNRMAPSARKRLPDGQSSKLG